MENEVQSSLNTKPLWRTAKIPRSPWTFFDPQRGLGSENLCGGGRQAGDECASETVLLFWEQEFSWKL